jgi:5-methylthioadenosine/S-adenosylhomocysteine deaminase
VQKAWRDDPSAMPLNELAAMVSINAAKALGVNAGQIKEGFLADLLIIDMDNYQFLSPAGFLENFVYSAHSDCVDSVICDGKFIMRGRVVEGEKEIIANARKQMNRVWIHE